MNTLLRYWDYASLMVELQLNMFGVKTRDERGAVSTEMAVVIAAMVAIAAVASVIFVAKVRSNANNIPDVVDPPG